MVWWLPAALVVGVYCGWQGYSRWLFARQPEPVGDGERRHFTVVVPFRNEAEHLPELLRSLSAQTYPAEHFDVVLVDDFSSDGSVALVEAHFGAAAGAMGVETEAPPRLRARGYASPPYLLHLADHYAERELVAHKKAALDLAIRHHARDGWILTTDADCSLPPDLLERLNALAGEGLEPQTLLGPVFNAPLRPNLCDHFQALDLAAYQFLTATSVYRGTPALANGACLAFRRSAFLAVDGYAGVDHLPSGDDVLLLHKLAGHFPPEAFAYLPAGAPVTTRPVDGWPALWRQRLRWAGKAGNYQSTYLQFAQALSFLASLAWVYLLLLLLISLPRDGAVPPSLLSLLLDGAVPPSILPLHPPPGTLLLLLLGKLLVDCGNLAAVLRRYGRTESLRWYPLVALVYPFFLVGVGSAALLGIKAPWKGRT